MILVTGATGILGRVIVLNLLQKGKKVRAVKRKSSNIEDVKNSYRFYTDQPEKFFNKIEWVEADFDDMSSLENLLTGIDEVYHCAAKVSFHPNDRREMYHTNLDGTRNLLYAAQTSSVKKFCFISSTAVLDGLNEQGEIDEDSNYNPKLGHSSYAKSKHFSEMEVWRSSAEGLSTVIVNPGVIIGSGNWNSSSGELFKTFEKFPYAMSGTSSYVDVRDVANISIQLMDKNVFGERFILISENKKFLEVANFVRKKLNKSPAKVLSKTVLKLGYFVNLLFGWLFSGLRIITKGNIETVSSHFILSNKKIREELNYTFIPVEESLDFHLKNYISDHKNEED